MRELPDLVVGQQYTFQYRLPDQQVDRWARLMYMGDDSERLRPRFSGEPLLQHEVALRKEWIKEIVPTNHKDPAWDRKVTW